VSTVFLQQGFNKLHSTCSTIEVKRREKFQYIDAFRGISYHETICHERLTFDLKSRWCTCTSSLSCHDEDVYDHVPQDVVSISLPIMLITVLMSARDQLIRLKVTRFEMMVQCLGDIGFRGK